MKWLVGKDYIYQDNPRCDPVSGQQPQTHYYDYQSLLIIDTMLVNKLVASSGSINRNLLRSQEAGPNT